MKNTMNYLQASFKGLLFFALMFCTLNAKSEKAKDFRDLNMLLDSLKTFQDDSMKLKFNQKILESFQAFLTPAESYRNPTDSLKKAGMVQASDKKFRIFTWNVPLSDGSHKYFGIIQMNPEKEANCQLFLLNDISNTNIEKIGSQTFRTPAWLGALYYKLIKVKSGKTEIYTLLATRFNSLFTTQKIIETLYFDERGMPVFGYPIIESGMKLEKRIVFEYSINARMGLRYDESREMIIFDHLAPSSPIHTGNYKFYGPDFSFDAYKFEKDRWVYIPNVDVRNEKRKTPVKPLKKSDK